MPIEIVTPACAVVVAFRAEPDEKVGEFFDSGGQFGLRAQFLFEGRRFAHGAEQVAVALQEQPDALGIVFFRHEGNAAKIHGATLESLYHHQPAQRRPLQQRNGLKHPRVQPVVRIPPAEPLRLAVSFQPKKRIDKIHDCFIRKILAGTPATIAFAGTGLLTTAFAPISALSPIVIPPNTIAP